MACQAGGSQVFKRVRKIGSGWKATWDHPLVRGTAPRDAKLVPSKTSRDTSAQLQRPQDGIKNKLHHLMAHGLLKFTSEMLQQSDPCAIMNQQLEEAARRRRDIIQEVTEEVFEEEWIA